ncbi:flagellar protein FlaG [Undibacterium sp. Ji67W]|uniref:flagellar protein FlaG n=1 Tax=Undibacterium sp. Ji67W TaxID=3413042 RepID=UPI003BF44B2A
MDVSAIALSGQANVAISSPSIQFGGGATAAASSSVSTSSLQAVGDQTSISPVPAIFDPGSSSSKANETDSLRKSAAALNQSSQPQFGSIEYTVDQQSDKMVLRVVDQETKQVLLQIPSKVALILSETIGNGGAGNLIHESA